VCCGVVMDVSINIGVVTDLPYRCAFQRSCQLMTVSVISASGIRLWRIHLQSPFQVDFFQSVGSKGCAFARLARSSRGQE